MKTLGEIIVLGNIGLLATLFAVMGCGPPEGLRQMDMPGTHKLANSLGAEYRSNPVRFKRDRKGNRVLSYGKIASISNAAEVTFGDGGPFTAGEPLVCGFSNRWDVADLTPSDWVAVSGTVDSVTLNKFGNVYRVRLAECELLMAGERGSHR